MMTFEPAAVLSERSIPRIAGRIGSVSADGFSSSSRSSRCTSSELIRLSSRLCGTYLMMSGPYNDAVSPESNPAAGAEAEPPTQHGRILSLDFGSKTIGLAVSDPLGITAQGLPTLRRKNKRADFAGLGEVIRRRSEEHTS